MVKISGIFKKIREKEKTQTPKAKEVSSIPSAPVPAEHEESNPVKSYFTNIVKFKTEKIEEVKPKIPEFRISSVIMKETKIVSIEESLKLYDEIICLMGELFKEDIDYNSMETKTITEQVGKMVDQLSLDNKTLLMLALIKDSIEPNYLLYHSVNTSIYAIEVGLGLGYERTDLMDLGISAVFHDIGMVKYLHLVNQPRSLTPKEYSEVKNHTISGAQILKEINGLSQAASDVAYQHHERIDGSGYPSGIKTESINKCAKIMGLVDVYDAMVHKRPYRDSNLPQEVVKEILNNKNAFEYELIKILIERLGVFPLGSLVELNTGEIARVVKLNHNITLRPMVEIIYDTDGKVPKENKMLDLTSQPTIYIKGSVRKTD